MKVLIVIPALGTVYGGPSRTAPALAEALARRGVTVDLVATDANGSKRLDVACHRWNEVDGYRVRYFPRVGKGEFKLSFSLSVWLWRHVADYDVVHINSNFNFPVVAAAVACRNRKVPYLAVPHGMLEPWALGYKSGKKKLYFNLIEGPLVLRGARLIQALNGNEAANLEKLRLGPAVAVLPNGINPQEVQSPGLAAETFLERYPAVRSKRMILFLHRVDPKKGLDLLAPAYAELRRHFPDTHLVVAGPATAGFEKTAGGYFRVAGLSDAVTFTGMIEGPLKAGAFAAAAIFVAPSYSEGFSMSILEAMAAGLPSVITTGCNFPEAGEVGAASVVPIDAEAISAALIELVKHPEAGRAMGARARRLVLEGYTWDKIAARFEELVGSLLPSPVPRQ